MNTIKNNSKSEILINKSRFISFIYKIENEVQVKNIINDLKKEYKDATHYCYAYTLGNIKRFNDDKEPSHTAGTPILNVLENNELDNALAVVIRYYGGVKLGIGGLTRAYGSSVLKVLETVQTTPLVKEEKVRIEFKYNFINEINYILKDYKITYKEFDENIIFEFIYEENKYPNKIDTYLITKNTIA